MDKPKPVKVECYKCGYTWYTQSRKKWITCPDCMTKVKREKAIVSEGEEEWE